MKLENTLMSISEFAKFSGLTRKTLLFYDDKDILKPTKKNENGYRFYSRTQIYEVTFIKVLRSLNYSYQKIRELRNNTEKRNIVEEIEKQIKAITMQQELLSTMLNKMNNQLVFLKELRSEKDQLAIIKRKKLDIICDKEEFEITRISLSEIFHLVLETLDTFPYFPDGIFIRKNNTGVWVFSFFRKIQNSNNNSINYATLHTKNIKFQETLEIGSLDELVNYFSRELNVTLQDEIYIEVYFIDGSPFTHDNCIFTLSIPTK
ncbi:hypothetical protein A7N94_01660 [Listeria monocytogenes]|uniref:helix-turn-helix domain-containing protein n=1 Tax=Listeria monocytogenes TaxID=1639 RepID=UPI000BDF54ED|nr:MerR family transcriptional regulator [Listeria monocytogenes]PCW48143.1 hypothetical protein A7N94_01660 [Listeria monocytogenes]RJA01321.1 MerR family transcriptional regulator [Listeria monocytogenes]